MLDQWTWNDELHVEIYTCTWYYTFRVVKKNTSGKCTQFFIILLKLRKVFRATFESSISVQFI